MKRQQLIHVGSRVIVSVLVVCNALSTAAQVPGRIADRPTAQPTAGPDDPLRSVATSGADVDLEPAFTKWGLPTRSQGTRGTCSVFTVTRAIEYVLAKKRRRSSRLSVEFLNWASNRAVGKNRDGGFFSDLWKGFAEYGICDEDELPYAAKFDPQLQPSPALLARARRYDALDLRLHWIKPWDPSRGLTDKQFVAVKETLRRGWPVCGGFLWPKEAQWSDGVLQMASRKNVRDGHSVLLVGFRDNVAQSGGGVFLIQNTSKGPRHGAMSYEYARTYMNDAAWIGYDADGSSE